MSSVTFALSGLHLVGGTRPAEARTLRRPPATARPGARHRAGDALVRMVLLHVVGPRLPEDLRTDLRRVVKARPSV